MKKMYIVMGPLIGHSWAKTPYSLHSTKEDAEFFVEADKILFPGNNLLLMEINLDPKLREEYNQKLIDAGMTIPDHLNEAIK